MHGKRVVLWYITHENKVGKYINMENFNEQRRLRNINAIILEKKLQG